MKANLWPNIIKSLWHNEQMFLSLKGSFPFNVIKADYIKQ